MLARGGQAIIKPLIHHQGIIWGVAYDRSSLRRIAPYGSVVSLLGALHLAWILHELLSRDHEDGCPTWQPQGVGSEAYLNGTSQGPTPEDARKDDHIRGRSK